MIVSDSRHFLKLVVVSCCSIGFRGFDVMDVEIVSTSRAFTQEEAKRLGTKLDCLIKVWNTPRKVGFDATVMPRFFSSLYHD